MLVLAHVRVHAHGRVHAHVRARAHTHTHRARNKGEKADYAPSE